MAGLRYEPRFLSLLLQIHTQLPSPMTSKLFRASILGLCFIAWGLKIVCLQYPEEKYFYGLASGYAVGPRCYFIFSQSRRKCLLDTSCLSLFKASFPHQAQHSAAQTTTWPCCFTPHAVWPGLVGAVWLSESVFMKSVTEQLKCWNGQLRERRKSSLALGPERSRNLAQRKACCLLPTSSQAAGEEAGTGGGVGLQLACQLMGQFTELSLKSVTSSLFSLSSF